MRKLRNDAGATLVELLITIVVGSLVAMAAMTVLLFGMQAHRMGTDTGIRQNEIQVGISVIRELLAENTITGISQNGDIQAENGVDKDGKIVEMTLLHYDADADAVYSSTDAKILEGVTEYSATWVNEKNPNLLKVTLKMDTGKKYAIRVYCRNVNLLTEETTDPSNGETTESTTEATTEATTESSAEPTTKPSNPLIGEPTETSNPLIGEDSEKPSNPLVDEGAGVSTQGGTNSYAQRKEPSADEILAGVLTDRNVQPSVRVFLSKLASQLGSTGRILTENGEGDYYSRWYIGSYEENPTWNQDTPWCACFVSWALAECGLYLEGEPARFANVDTFWVELVTAGDWKDRNPEAGDLIFFDWIVDSVYNPQHVGVVLAESNGWIYTIEGNSNGVVALRQYAADDARILGYGILNWK